LINALSLASYPPERSRPALWKNKLIKENEKAYQMWLTEIKSNRDSTGMTYIKATFVDNNKLVELS